MYGGTEVWLHAFLASVLVGSFQLNVPAALLSVKETRLIGWTPEILYNVSACWESNFGSSVVQLVA